MLNIHLYDKYLDPFLYERKAIEGIQAGIANYIHGDFERSYNQFILSLWYLAFDFPKNDYNLYKTFGVTTECSDFFVQGISDSQELILIDELEQEIKTYDGKESNFSNSNIKKVLCGTFVLTYSIDQSILNRVLSIVKHINGINRYNSFSLYQEVKVLFLLGQTQDIDIKRVISNTSISNDFGRKVFPALRFLELAITIKENDLNYFIKLLSFYSSNPHSIGPLVLISKIKNIDLLKFDKQSLKVQALIDIKNDKRYKRTIPYFLKLISEFSKDDLSEIISPIELIPATVYKLGDIYAILLCDINPSKGNYEAVDLLKIFRAFIKSHLEYLKVLADEKFLQDNPDYIDESDLDDDEPYTDEDFINDVFDGDASNSCNID